MKITEIYISAFGGLKDFTLKLDENFTVIYGENEKGKTTVMSFIRAMFYGTGKKVSSLQNSMRVKYTPFDNSVMGGRITFEHENKRYRLERQFNKSDSTDSITLTDLDTGISTKESSDIGVKFFGVGADAFEKSMFIPVSVNADDTLAAGELNARLSAVALTGDQSTSYEKIEKRIRDAKEKIISKSQRAGSLIKLKAELDSLEERLAKANKMANEKVLLSAECDNLKRDLASLYKKYEVVKKLYDSREDIKNTEKLRDYLKKKEELDKLNKELTLSDGKTVDANFINKYQFCTSKIAQQEEKCGETEEEIKALEKRLKETENLSPEQAEKRIEEEKAYILSLEEDKKNLEKELEELQKCLSEAQETASKAKYAKKPFNPLLLIFGIAFLCIGAVTGFLFENIFFSASALGAVLLILSFIIKPADIKYSEKANESLFKTKEKISSVKENISVISQNITLKTGELNLLISIENADKNAREKSVSELEAKKEKLNTEKEKLLGLKEEYSAFAGNLGISEEELLKMEPKIEEQKNIKITLGVISKDLGNISYEEAREKLKKAETDGDLSNIDFAKVENEKAKLEEDIQKARDNITEKDTQLKTSFRNMEQPEILTREINGIKEKMQDMFDFYSTCELSLEVLSESFSELRRSFGNVLESKTLENFSFLTKGKYKNIAVDKDLNLQAESKDFFGLKEIGYLSTGTYDQAFLSLRLAICSLMAKENPLPVILDDSLANYDDERTAVAVEFLKSYAKENQVLLFTCHSVVEKAARNTDVAVTKL